MADAASRKILSEFIELYKNSPCLWFVKSRDYNNRAKKELAYTKLLNKYRELKSTADKTAVLKKISGIRTVYRKEVAKVEKSKKSGAVGDQVYIPMLWYFDLMSFLDDQGTIRKKKSAIKEETQQDSSSPTIVPETPVSALVSPPTVPETPVSASVSPPTVPETPMSASVSPPTVQQPKRLRKKARYMTQVTNRNRKSPLIEKALPRLEPEAPVGDKIPTIAKVWGEKLTALDSLQRIFAEKAINDILFEAALGNLNRDPLRINEPFMSVTSFSRASNNSASSSGASY